MLRLLFLLGLWRRRSMTRARCCPSTMGEWFHGWSRPRAVTGVPQTGDPCARRAWSTTTSPSPGHPHCLQVSTDPGNKLQWIRHQYCEDYNRMLVFLKFYNYWNNLILGFGWLFKLSCIKKWLNLVMIVRAAETNWFRQVRIRAILNWNAGCSIARIFLVELEHFSAIMF